MPRNVYSTNMWPCESGGCVGPDFGLLKGNKGSEPYGIISRMSKEKLYLLSNVFPIHLLLILLGHKINKEKPTTFFCKYIYVLKCKFLREKLNPDTKKSIKIWILASLSWSMCVNVEILVQRCYRPDNVVFEAARASV